MEFKIKNIDKTALDYAKEKNHREIVELLIDVLEQLGGDNVDNNEEKQKLKTKIELLRNENSKLKKENSSVFDGNKKLNDENESLKVAIQELKEKSEKGNKTLKEENKKLEEKVKTFENIISSLKDKSKEFRLYEREEYEEERNIGEGPRLIVKIVHKEKQEKYVEKELFLYDYQAMKQFYEEYNIIIKYRHPCIIRIYGINYGDETHKPSIILSYEPK